MSKEKDKWIEAVATLIKLTQEGELVWNTSRPSDSLKKQPDDRIGPVFTTKYKGRELRLYERTYEAVLPQLTFGQPELYWATTVVLELVAEDGFSSWAFPREDVLRDLLSAVQYQAAQVKDFLDDVLYGDLPDEL